MRDFLVLIVFFYCTVSFFATLTGIRDKKFDTTYPSSIQDCNYSTRVELLFPAYKLGCYLGETVE